jgi:hypothetical protein
MPPKQYTSGLTLPTPFLDMHQQLFDSLTGDDK